MIDRISIRSNLLPEADYDRLLALYSFVATIDANTIKFNIYPVGNKNPISVCLKKEHKGYIRITFNARKLWFGAKSLLDLNLQQFKESVFRLANCLNLKLSFILNADVIKIEIGANIKMPEHSSSVFPFIAGHKYLQSVTYPNAIYRKGTQYTLIIYDKLNERQYGKRVYNKNLQERFNILRFEARLFYQHPLIHRMTVQDVFRNWNSLIDFWIRQFYCEITYINQPVFDLKKCTAKDFKNYCFFRGICCNDNELLFGLKNTSFSPKARNRIKSQFEKANSKYNNGDSISGLIPGTVFIVGESYKN
ncbi:MAG: hypothetical protein HY951_15370 [Bacteroidia bacterium]|nr:hypothetical protein [Bacteroidia bacterium]